MVQPVVFTFPANCSNLQVWCGHRDVRLKTFPVQVPDTCPFREELTPGKEPWARHWGQQSGW